MKATRPHRPGAAPRAYARVSPSLRPFLLFGLLLAGAGGAHAAVILSHDVGATSGGTAQDPGLALTTPAGGPWTNITFNWYQAGTGASYAIGKLFLLNQTYAGTPQDLSASTAGYLAEATGDGSVYTFSPTLTLQGNTRYYFFADLGLPNGFSTFVSDGNSDIVTTQSYGAANGSLNFQTRPFYLSYSLNSSLPTVPELPTTALLLAPLGAGLAWAGRRRSRPGQA